MIRWLQRIFIGHNHKWKIMRQDHLSDWNPATKDWYRAGFRYTQQCEECGKVTHYDAL